MTERFIIEPDATTRAGLARLVHCRGEAPNEAAIRREIERLLANIVAERLPEVERLARARASLGRAHI